MKRIAVCVLVLTAALGVAAPASQACDYTINLFNHRLDGDQLRLYLDMRTALGAQISGALDAAKFDTVLNPGDAPIGDAGKYQDKGNGLATLLMLDRSGSMRRMQAKERDAAIRYIDSMAANDQVGLYFFAQEAWVSDFLEDPGTLRSLINKEMRGDVPPALAGEVTPLYSHLIQGIARVEKLGKRELSFILVMSDGQEEVGGYTAQQVIDKAREKRVPIFAVGFFNEWREDGRKKNNRKELEILKRIAEETGGRFIEADAQSDIGDIFVAARRRAANFIVLDTTLCGISRQAAAQSGKTDVQVVYEDCKSNTYAVTLPPLDKDLPACAQCKADTDCQETERCAGSSCEKLPCNKCQKAQEHQCADAKCGADNECGAECRCDQGKCVEKPPCKEWQTFDAEKKECVGKGCKAAGDCPSAAECCKEKCAEKRDCSAWMKKDSQTCACLDIACKYDDQCPDGILCDGEYCSDPEGKQVNKASCKESKRSVNGKCETVKCTQESDCLDDRTPEKWVCAPKIGLMGRDDKDDDRDRTCQLLRTKPCEEWEEEVDDACRVVICKEEEDCPDGAACDEKAGECVAGGLCGRKNMPVCLGVAGLGALAIVFLFLALRRRRRDEEAQAELPAADVQVPEPGKRQTEVAPIAPEEPVHKRITQADPGLEGGRGFKGTLPDDRRMPSPYVLEIDVQGQVSRRPLVFGISTLGRDAGDIVVRHDIVSSSHLTLDVRDYGITVTDLDSTNGTWIGGQRLAAHRPRAVALGEQIMLGGTVCLTILSGQGGAAPPSGARHKPTVIVE